MAGHKKNSKAESKALSVIKCPMVCTEDAAQRNTLRFLVRIDASKDQIKQALAKQYGIEQIKQKTQPVILNTRFFSFCMLKARVKEALDQLLHSTTSHSNSALYASLIKQCTEARALYEGTLVHELITRVRPDSDTFLGSQLVHMYGRCGSVESARQVFDNLRHRSAFTWSMMINAYAQNGHLRDSKTLFCLMPQRDAVDWNAVFSAYANNGHLQEARGMFEEMPQKNVVTWTCLITAYTKDGHFKEGLQVFQLMDLEGIAPNEVTLVALFDASAAADYESLRMRQIIHSDILESELLAEVKVANALVHMYGKCGCLQAAVDVFDKMPNRNVVSWTVFLAAYAHSGHITSCLRTLQRMLLEGQKPNEITFITVVDACASCKALPEGRFIHALIVDCRFQTQLKIGNALVNLYGKCGSLESAKEVFDDMPKRNVVSWSAMMKAYADKQQPRDALQLFKVMILEGLKPNEITFISTLDACASRASIEDGKVVHSILAETASRSDVVVATALVNMYGKCGSLQNALEVFQKLPQGDIILWNAVIAAYAHNRHCKEALSLLQEMELNGVRPDQFTFSSVLSACSHAGLLEDGKNYLVSLRTDYGIERESQHYVCMIDLLGRAGYLDEAEDLIDNMPFQPDVVAWTVLLGACRIRGDVLRGIRAARGLNMLDPGHPAAYVLLSNACVP